MEGIEEVETAEVEEEMAEAEEVKEVVQMVEMSMGSPDHVEGEAECIVILALHQHYGRCIYYMDMHRLHFVHHS